MHVRIFTPTKIEAKHKILFFPASPHRTLFPNSHPLLNKLLLFCIQFIENILSFNPHRNEKKKSQLLAPFSTVFSTQTVIKLTKMSITTQLLMQQIEGTLWIAISFLGGPHVEVGLLPVWNVGQNQVGNGARQGDVFADAVQQRGNPILAVIVVERRSHQIEQHRYATSREFLFLFLGQVLSVFVVDAQAEKNSIQLVDGFEDGPTRTHLARSTAMGTRYDFQLFMPYRRMHAKCTRGFRMYISSAVRMNRPPYRIGCATVSCFRGLNVRATIGGAPSTLRRTRPERFRTTVSLGSWNVLVSGLAAVSVRVLLSSTGMGGFWMMLLF